MFLFPMRSVVQHRFLAQQSWSGLIMTIPADVFPLSSVGTVRVWWALADPSVAIFGLIAGALLGHGFSYTVLFTAIGTFHLMGFLVLVYVGGKIQPLRIEDLTKIESHG